MIGASGSSPRMRGAHPCRTGGPSDGGIIPADAGSTPAGPTGRRNTGDHPRGCGEHQMGATRRLSPPGSSPRMRGAPTTCIHSGVPMRIIPADAGSTRQLRPDSFRGGDHPRGCGEHTRLSNHPQPMNRIIPADAGSTNGTYPTLGVG